ncbi:GNAT family N-acetyltransferase [Luteococcus sp. OSA5]|uniref:GNAT family N-acetyltransferase n=1 Tax=Luteococcus sp. OSA5 TaxID=3401630 RepID=UPI003B43C281
MIVCEIAVPTRDSFEPSWVMEQSDQIRLAEALDVLGTDDFHMPLALGVHSLRRQLDSWRVSLVAVDGVAADQLPVGPHGLPELSWEAERAPERGRVLAAAGLTGHVHENTTLAELHVVVAREHRRRGVGRLLLQAAEQVAAGRGCTTLQCWTDHPQVPGEQGSGRQPTLSPPTGFGTIALDDPATAFALAHGYALEQCERHSVCPLPGDDDVLEQLWNQSLPHAEGYQLRTIVDELPEELLEPFAAMMRHFTEEMPSAGLDSEPEDWTPQRVRRAEEARRATGVRSLTTVAMDLASGAMAASTNITTDPAHDEVCYQQHTVVDAGHRGHRLGLLTKIKNHRAVGEHFRQRRRLHTWNAGENRWMLAINDQLGFVAGVTEGAWQKRL